LQIANSPMVARGDVVIFDEAAKEAYDKRANEPAHNAGRYIKRGVVHSSKVRSANRAAGRKATGRKARQKRGK
jgi:hypothetical protein